MEVREPWRGLGWRWPGRSGNAGSRGECKGVDTGVEASVVILDVVEDEIQGAESGEVGEGQRSHRQPRGGASGVLLGAAAAS